MLQRRYGSCTDGIGMRYRWYRNSTVSVLFSNQIGIVSIQNASTVRFWSWLYPNCRSHEPIYRLPENVAYFLCHVLHFVKCHGHVLCDFYFFIFISKPLICLQIWIYKCNIYNIRVQSVNLYIFLKVCTVIMVIRQYDVGRDGENSIWEQRRAFGCHPRRIPAVNLTQWSEIRQMNIWIRICMPSLSIAYCFTLFAVICTTSCLYFFYGIQT